ncbi:methyltransferase domain-containing protein [Nitrospinae bacterium AH_259_B05_G02_I21]|nr:methyltransferase domain-containing protein [Nitrospinae bacterium AH_259_B05_G02_I21]
MSDAEAYESYVGRWSRRVAHEFLGWLGVPEESHWLDVGCGTGALAQVILDVASPKQVTGIDPSEGYLWHARKDVVDDRASFEIGDARALRFGADSHDAVVGGLIFNFVPDVRQGVAEMTRITRSGGIVGGYVWDYADKMQLMRHFWDAAAALDPEAVDLDEGRRFPLCKPGPLKELFETAGLRDVDVRAIDVPTHFRDFDDYWSPFLGGQFPAPGYAMSLDEERRVDLRERIRSNLPIEADGSIRLVARAWAVRGAP